VTSRSTPQISGAALHTTVVPPRLAHRTSSPVRDSAQFPRSISKLCPPPVKATDAEVIAFVAKNAGAVGYVAAGTALPPDVRALTLVD